MLSLLYLIITNFSPDDNIAWMVVLADVLGGIALVVLALMYNGGMI